MNDRDGTPRTRRWLRPAVIAAGVAGTVTLLAAMVVLNAVFDVVREPLRATCVGRCGLVPDQTPSSPAATEDSTALPRPTESTPSPSPSASPSTSTSPAAAPGGLAVSYAMGHRWDSGFIGQITVTNRGPGTARRWQVALAFPGRTITSAWTDTVAARARPRGGGALEASGTGLPAGSSVSIGFQARGRPGPPGSCTVNGTPC